VSYLVLSVFTLIAELTRFDDFSYPIGQFLTTYKVPLHPVPDNYVSPWQDFKITVDRSWLNPVQMTRSIELVLEHPGVIWPVIAFEADVISWGTLTVFPSALRESELM